jgi:membrane protein implicated in regulation of membrane protease activity
MLIIFGAVALVVGVIAALALDNWWILVGVLVVHFIATMIVVAYTLRQAGKGGDKPDPVTEARIEAEGSPAARERMRREALR